MASETTDARRCIEVLRRFDPHGRRSLAQIAVLSFVGGLFEAGVLVLLTAVAVATTSEDKHHVSVGPITTTPRWLLLGALALVVAGVANGRWLAKAVARTTVTVSLNARQALLEAYHAASYQRKSQDRVAALQEALTTYVDRFTSGFGSLANLVAGVLNLVSFAVAALVVNPFAAIALAVVGALLLLVLRPAARRTRKATEVFMGGRRRYAEGATESVLLAREHAVFGVSGRAGSHLLELDQDVSVQYGLVRYLANFIPRLYQGLAFGMAIVGLLAVTSLELSDLAAIGAVVLLLVRSLSYAQQVLSGLQILSEQRPFIDTMVDLLDSYSAEPRRRGTTPIGPIERLELRDVSFAYPGHPPALRELSLDIRPGETIGVLGPSGAGKTTLVNLLLRLYEPTEGRIEVNGIDLHDADDDEWHRRTAIVPQEPRLLLGTVADNVRFLRDLADDDVRQATVDANIADFVATLPQGIESPVGELGAGLSGGQRQRICIARALAGHPDVLVLDEPTSALDGESEAAIQRTLEQLKGKVTMVIVAHRISTLSICDRLVVLQDGRAAAVGSQAELAASSPYYREAVRFAGL
jgi:ABC-type multidrug transport system fused ATPase/permease subunit